MFIAYFLENRYAVVYAT